MEKRQCQRTQYPCPILLEHPVLGATHATCEDVSDTGLFVRLDRDQALPIGCELTLQVVTGLPEAKRLQTRVVRTTKSGLGLRFLV